MSYRYTIDCIHGQWVGKPDPSGFGKFTFRTNHPGRFLERVKDGRTKAQVLRVRDHGK